MSEFVTYPCDCPRSGGVCRVKPRPDMPDDGTCFYCGSLAADTFMARLEASDVELGPTDKDYKVYVHNDGGQPFKQTYGETYEEPATCGHEGHVEKKFRWHCRDMAQAKFYFDHLSEAQRVRFVELLNQKKLKIGYPGHFYRRPFFVTAS
jgi:hypothetical protein